MNSRRLVLSQINHHQFLPLLEMIIATSDRVCNARLVCSAPSNDPMGCLFMQESMPHNHVW